jgi:hypothetical protein
MRIFFLKATSLVVGLGLIFNISGTVADRVAPQEDWRIEHQQRVSELQAEAAQVKAVTLGNSHSDSIDYSVLGIEGTSLAFAAADLFEIEKYAAYLEENLPGLQTVFIAVSYYSFVRDNAELESLRSRRIRFYSMIPVSSPIQGDFPNFLLGRLENYTHVMSVARSDNWKGVWHGLFYGPSLEPFPYDGVETLSEWGECAHYTVDQLDIHALEIAGRNVSSSMQMAAEHPGLEQDAFDALSRTIERLQSRGIQVILFTPPYYQMYSEYFEEQGSTIIEQGKQAAGRLQEIYQVPYYDFSMDAEIISHPELFYNSDHLSECGKREFSEKLLDKMGEKRKLDSTEQTHLLTDSSLRSIWFPPGVRHV